MQSFRIPACIEDYLRAKTPPTFSLSVEDSGDAIAADGMLLSLDDRVRRRAALHLLSAVTSR